MGLELYAKIEQFLDFEEETVYLHKEFLKLIFEKDLDNILDVGCGQGAFLNHLMANGKNASGIDLSVEQIKVCKSFNLDAKAIPLQDVTQTYDCATAIFDVINYIPATQLNQFIQDAHSVLNSRGYFIFDTNSLFGFEEVAQGSLNINLENKFIAIDAFYEDKKLNTNITLFTQEKKSLFRQEQDSITQYYHSVETLKKSLKSAGFKIEEIININLHTKEEADKLIFVCQKN
mgnify:CR=1 FL=1